MNLFKKEQLKIHVYRLNGELYSYDSDKTLIENLFNGDGVQKFTHLLFKGNPSQCDKSTEILPTDKESLMSDCGEFTIIETPAAAVTAAQWAIAQLIVAVAAVAYSFYVAGKYSAQNTDSTSSANRSLTERQNRERPMERIEDIAGQVRSYYTMISPDYRKFVDSVEVEYSLGVIGVGYYDISDVKDGDTIVSAIPDSGACFYNPNVMPGNSANAFLTTGEAFDEEVKTIYKAESVSGGEVLQTDVDRRYYIYIGDGFASKNESFTGSGVYWGTITSTDETESFTDYMSLGDTIEALAFSVTATIGNLSGTYKVQAISDYTIIVSSTSDGDVSSVNSDWNDLVEGTDYLTDGDNAFFYSTNYGEYTWTDDYYLPGDDRTDFWVNFVAETGLKYDNGGPLFVDIEINYATANSSGVRTGDWISGGTVTISGRTSSRIGITKEITTSFTGGMVMRCKRLTQSLDGATIQDVTLDSMYGSSPIGVSNFGNVTTVQTRTYAKGRAANLSDRNFNCLATRKLYPVQSDGSLGTTLTATKRFIDYFAYATTSDYIGRRDTTELDYQEEYDQYTDIVSYFGTTDAAEFCYTFDDNEISFQDTADLICGAVFSVPIRKNGIISTKFEQPTDPRTLFNHRNKIPNSQTITRSFVNDDFTDGVEYQWVDPDNDDSISTIYIPTNNSALRSELVESKGVRNYNQAYWAAYRRYNKILNQRISIEDTVTSEGQLLSQLDLAAITDDTKAKIFSGEVIGVSGLTLYLNQPVEFYYGETHSISLRKRNGTIEILSCTEGSDSMSVVLGSTPTETPYTGTEEERTRFTFCADTDLGSDYYLISEIDRTTPNEIKISGYNYTEAYYQNDTDTPS